MKLQFTGNTAIRSLAMLGALAVTAGGGTAFAQVAYHPLRRAPPPPVYYGYPVPYGVLQPNEVLGTSPSFEITTGAYGAAPTVRVVRRCQYPDGWNETDFVRDVNGIPTGIDHTCPAGGPGSQRVAY